MAEGWDQFGPDYDFPDFEGRPNTYLLASTPRCGSHYLGHLLFGTGVLGSPLEYFHEKHAQRWMTLLGVDNLPAMIAGLYRRRTSPSGWFGVKAHWAQFMPIARNPEYSRLLRFQKFIEIRRRDLVAQAVSHEIARQTNAWISFHEAGQTPVYDFDTLHRTARALEQNAARWGIFFENNKIEQIVVEYEDLMADPEAVISAILADFGLSRADHQEPKWQPEKQASALNAEWCARYVEDLKTRSD